MSSWLLQDALWGPGFGSQTPFASSLSAVLFSMLSTWLFDYRYHLTFQESSSVDCSSLSTSHKHQCIQQEAPTCTVSCYGALPLSPPPTPAVSTPKTPDALRVGMVGTEKGKMRDHYRFPVGSYLSACFRESNVLSEYCSPPVAQAAAATWEGHSGCF